MRNVGASTGVRSPAPAAAPSALLIAFGFSLFAIGIFVWQFREAWDVAAYWQLRAAANSPLAIVAARLTELGGAAIMVPLGLAATAWLVGASRRPEALWLFLTIGSGRLLIEFAKMIADRSRPALADRLVSVDTASFPSSHSAGAMLTSLAITVALDRGPAWWLGAVTFALAIGSTRVILGVHWPSDVLAGWGLGMLWVGIGALALREHRNSRSCVGPVALAGTAAMTIIIGLGAAKRAAVPNEVRLVPALDARQGVAAGHDGIYAIDDTMISRLARPTGTIVARARIGTAVLNHLNSCEVDDRELVCAISNFPNVPMRSAIVRVDSRSLRLIALRELPASDGSLTWISRHNGEWWGCLANYDGSGGQPGRDHRMTMIVRLTPDLVVRQQFVLPAALLARLAPSSLSGGSWGADGNLYVKGHDRAEIYVLRPDRTALRLIETLPAATHGQALAWDEALPGVLWEIDRARRLLVATRLPARPVKLGMSRNALPTAPRTVSAKGYSLPTHPV